MTPRYLTPRGGGAERKTLYSKYVKEGLSINKSQEMTCKKEIKRSNNQTRI